MSLWEFLEPRLSVQGRVVPILWWVCGLACQVAQKYQGAESGYWSCLGILTHCVFRTYN